MVVNDGPGSPDDGRDDQTDPGPVHTWPEIDAAPDPEQYFLLHDAAENGSPETVAELAQHIDDVDFVDDDEEDLRPYRALDSRLQQSSRQRPRPGRRRSGPVAADDERLVSRTAQPGRLPPRSVQSPAWLDRSVAAETAAVTEARRLIAALGRSGAIGWVWPAWPTSPRPRRHGGWKPYRPTLRTLQRSSRISGPTSTTARPSSASLMCRADASSANHGDTPRTSPESPSACRPAPSATECSTIPRAAITERSSVTASWRKGTPTPAVAAYPGRTRRGDPHHLSLPSPRRGLLLCPHGLASDRRPSDHRSTRHVGETLRTGLVALIKQRDPTISTTVQARA